MDSGGMKLENSSANNRLLQYSKNPPATLTTNATTNKHNEANFPWVIVPPTDDEQPRKLTEYEEANFEQDLI